MDHDENGSFREQFDWAVMKNLPWLDDLKAQISAALIANRLGHAPLIQGPSGVGKRVLADWLSRRILCLEPDGRAACGQCRSCNLIESGTHPDFFDIGIPEDKRAIPVDSIRELNGRLQLTASLSERRIGRVMPAEAMNKNAANALLKTLEEPAGNAWLILVSDQPGQLPATVRSRCQVISVRPPEHAQALAWLKECVRQLPNQVSADETAQALTLAGEAPLAALALLEGEGLAFGFSIRDGLIATANGEPVQEVLSSDWTADAPLTWRWLATWVALVLHQSMKLSDDRQLIDELPRDISPQSVGQLWQQALQGSALAQGNARQDLLIGKWLLEWQEISRKR